MSAKIEAILVLNAGPSGIKSSLIAIAPGISEAAVAKGVIERAGTAPCRTAEVASDGAPQEDLRRHGFHGLSYEPTTGASPNDDSFASTSQAIVSGESPVARR